MENEGIMQHSSFPAVFFIFADLIFVIKHNWQIQIQNHENQSQLSRAINYIQVGLHLGKHLNSCIYRVPPNQLLLSFYPRWVVLEVNDWNILSLLHNSERGKENPYSLTSAWRNWKRAIAGKVVLYRDVFRRPKSSLKDGRPIPPPSSRPTHYQHFKYRLS